MKTYYRKMSKAVKVCYLVSFAGFILTLTSSLFVLFNVVPSVAKAMSTRMTVLSGIIAAECMLIVSTVMSKAVLSTELNIKGYELNEKFSIAWVVFSIILSSLVQVFVVALFYYKGRKDYYI